MYLDDGCLLLISTATLAELYLRGHFHPELTAQFPPRDVTPDREFERVEDPMPNYIFHHSMPPDIVHQASPYIKWAALRKFDACDYKCPPWVKLSSKPVFRDGHEFTGYYNTIMTSGHFPSLEELRYEGESGNLFEDELVPEWSLPKLHTLTIGKMDFANMHDLLGLFDPARFPQLRVLVLNSMVLEVGDWWEFFEHLRNEFHLSRLSIGTGLRGPTRRFEVSFKHDPRPLSIGDSIQHWELEAWVLNLSNIDPRTYLDSTMKRCYIWNSEANVRKMLAQAEREVRPH